MFKFKCYIFIFTIGYQHSAFSFGIESHVTQSNINSTVVPPGALVNLLQKGIQFIEGELCVSDVSFLLERSIKSSDKGFYQIIHLSKMVMST